MISSGVNAMLCSDGLGDGEVGKPTSSRTLTGEAGRSCDLL